MTYPTIPFYVKQPEDRAGNQAIDTVCERFAELGIWNQYIQCLYDFLTREHLGKGSEILDTVANDFMIWQAHVRVIKSKLELSSKEVADHFEAILSMNDEDLRTYIYG